MWSLLVGKPVGALLEKYESCGVPVSSFGVSGVLQGNETPVGYFLRPWGVAVDSTGNVYVDDSWHKVIDEFDSTGKYLGQIDGGETPAHHFIDPGGVAVNSLGDVYVSDSSLDVFGTEVAQNALTVSVTGGLSVSPGAGQNSSVLSSPAGIEETQPCAHPVRAPFTGDTCPYNYAATYVNSVRGCEERCSAQFDPGTKVTLTETPVTGFKFVGWTGCETESGPGKEECLVTLNSDIEVKAAFVERTKYPLEVKVIGDGVVSGPGFECHAGETCTRSFNEGEAVPLVEKPSSTSTMFVKWTGCETENGPGKEECTVSATAARSVTAEFKTIPQHPIEVIKTGSGAGTVTSIPSGIECGPVCSHPFNTGETVTLTEYPNSTSLFAGWSGCETESGPGNDECTVKMSAAKSVTVEFNAIAQQALTVTKTGSGVGTVTSSDGAIDCGGACAHTYNEGAVVTLTATPSTTSTFASTFAGWSGGGCTGTGVCEVSLTATTKVTAQFDALAPEACPNEALRAESNVNPLTKRPYSLELPECRSYELVTPPYKEGVNSNVTAISPEGSDLIVKSLGNFGDAENNPEDEGATYELSRGQSGWSSVSLNPPASQFPYGQYLDATPDLGRTLWWARSSSQSVYAADLYLREADGSMHDLGPIQPPSATEGPPGTGRPPLIKEGESVGSTLKLDGFDYEGASTDLSRVLFSISSAHQGEAKDPLWPGDMTATGKEYSYPSLYEYIAGESGPPLLVGVNDAGELIGQCGVGGDGISADGETIFFTPTSADETINSEKCDGKQPPVAELFARIDNGQPGAHTIAISEPEPADCEACNTTVGLENAVYQGASKEGTKVFFTTKQELLPGHRGTNLYEYDFDGPEASHEHPDGRITLVSAGAAEPEFEGVVCVSDDGSHIYFKAGAVLTSTPTVSVTKPRRKQTTSTSMTPKPVIHRSSRRYRHLRVRKHRVLPMVAFWSSRATPISPLMTPQRSHRSFVMTRRRDSCCASPSVRKASTMTATQAPSAPSLMMVTVSWAWRSPIMVPRSYLKASTVSLLGR